MYGIHKEILPTNKMKTTLRKKGQRLKQMLPGVGEGWGGRLSNGQ